MLQELAAQAELAYGLREENRKLLGLLIAIKTGAIHPLDIAIDPVNGTWSYTPPDQQLKASE
jgi:hypothetical protein